MIDNSIVSCLIFFIHENWNGGDASVRLKVIKVLIFDSEYCPDSSSVGLHYHRNEKHDLEVVHDVVWIAFKPISENCHKVVASSNKIYQGSIVVESSWEKHLITKAPVTWLPRSEISPIDVVVPAKTVDFSPCFGCKAPPESFFADFHASENNEGNWSQFFREILGWVPKVDDHASLDVSFDTLAKSHPQWEQGYDIEHDSEVLIFRFHLLWNIMFALVAIHEKVSGICSICESPGHTRDQISKEKVLESHWAKWSSKHIKEWFGKLESCVSIPTRKTALETE